MSAKFKPLPLVTNFQAKDDGCSVTVSFGSIGSGTDLTTEQRVEALLEMDPAVAEVQPYLRGREGETDLCIRLQDDGEIDRLFAALSAVASDGFLVRISTKDGREFRSTGKP